MGLSNRKVAQLRSLKRGGDMVAEGLLDGLPDIQLSKDTEGTVAADTIQVTGKLKDSASDLVVEVIDTGAGATATVAVGGGTPKVGNGTTKVWLKPAAGGVFKINVLDALAAEDVLFVVTSSTGDVAMMMLTFA